MIEANVKCLLCGNTYVTNHHECNTGCQVKGGRVKHDGVCARCARRLMKSFIRQIEYPNYGKGS